MPETSLKIADFKGTELEPILRALDTLPTHSGEAPREADGELSPEEQNLDCFTDPKKPGVIDQTDYKALVAHAERQGLGSFSLASFVTTWRNLPRYQLAGLQSATARPLAKTLYTQSIKQLKRLGQQDLESYPTLAEALESLRLATQIVTLEPAFRTKSPDQMYHSIFKKPLGPHGNYTIATALSSRVSEARERGDMGSALEWQRTLLEYKLGHEESYYSAEQFRDEILAIVELTAELPSTQRYSSLNELRSLTRQEQTRLGALLGLVMQGFEPLLSDPEFPVGERKQLLLDQTDFYLGPDASKCGLDLEIREAKAKDCLSQYERLAEKDERAVVLAPRRLVVAHRQLMRREKASPQKIFNHIAEIIALRAIKGATEHPFDDELMNDMQVLIKDCALYYNYISPGWSEELKNGVTNILVSGFVSHVRELQTASKTTNVINDGMFRHFLRGYALQIEALIALGHIKNNQLLDISRIKTLTNKPAPKGTDYARFDLLYMVFFLGRQTKAEQQKIYDTFDQRVNQQRPADFLREPELMTALFQRVKMAWALGDDTQSGKALRQAEQMNKRLFPSASMTDLVQAGWSQKALEVAAGLIEAGENIRLEDRSTIENLARSSAPRKSRAKLIEYLQENMQGTAHETYVGVPTFDQNQLALLAPQIRYAQLVRMVAITRERDSLQIQASIILNELRDRQLSPLPIEAESGGLGFIAPTGVINLQDYASEDHNNWGSFTPPGAMLDDRTNADFSLHTHESQGALGESASKGDQVTNVAWQMDGLVITRDMAAKLVHLNYALPQGISFAMGSDRLMADVGINIKADNTEKIPEEKVFW